MLILYCYNSKFINNFFITNKLAYPKLFEINEKYNHFFRKMEINKKYYSFNDHPFI